MNIREIEIQFPSLNHEEAIANILIVKTEVTQEEEKFVIKDFEPFHHTFLVIECNSDESFITFNATKHITLQVIKGVSIINLYDLSDFTYEKEGDLEFWFDKGFKGSVYAVSRYGGFL
jgi:hypothetical protein